MALPMGKGARTMSWGRLHLPQAGGSSLLSTTKTTRRDTGSCRLLPSALHVSWAKGMQKGDAA